MTYVHIVYPYYSTNFAVSPLPHLRSGMKYQQSLSYINKARRQNERSFIPLAHHLLFFTRRENRKKNTDLLLLRITALATYSLYACRSRTPGSYTHAIRNAKKSKTNSGQCPKNVF